MSAADAGPQRPLGWRLGFGTSLTLAMTVSTFPQFALGVLGPLIMDDLTISRTALGALTTVLFLVSAVLSPVTGPLVDRLGGHRVLVALFVLAGAAFAALGLAPSLPWLLGAVSLAGLPNALGNPVTNALVASRIAPGRQGVLMGVKQSGVQIGAFLSGSALPTVAVALGWRGAMLLSAGVAALALLTTPVARATPLPAASVDARDAPGAAPLAGFVFWLAGYALLMGAGVSAFIAYLPLYAVEELGLSVPVAGLAAAVVGLVGVGARIWWARHSERLARTQRSLALLAGLSAVAQLGVWAAATAGPWLLWVAVAGLGATAVAWNSVGMLAIVREVPHATGKASGVVLAAFYLGLAASPAAMGATVDRTGSYAAGWLTLAAVFALAAVLAGAWSRRLPMG